MISGPLDPRALVAYGIATGMIQPPKPTVSADCLIRRMYEDKRPRKRKHRKAVSTDTPRTGKGRMSAQDATAREQQIHALTVAGKTQDQIAERLGINRKTVRRYLKTLV